MSKSRANFVRLAEKRTCKVLKDLELLSNLSNRSNYAYYDEDVRKIFATLSRKLKETQSKFDSNLESKKVINFEL